MAEEDLECGRWLLWDSVASYEALVLRGASSGVIKLWNPLSTTDAGFKWSQHREAWLRKHRNLTLDYGKSFFLDDRLENGTPRWKKDAATALSNLCIYQGNKGRAVRAGIVPALVKMLSDSSSHRMVDEALTILSVLASNLDAKAAIVKANTLPALIGILQTGQARNRENATAILLSLCKRDNEKLVAIGRLGAVMPLMDLTKNGTERGKRKTTSLLEILRKACQ
ncbi:PREDICTED: U-box domain-containing protein 11-like [Brassica oleracea var. oleracea]|uniref:U-box domain-containing protein 11-like n=1 Tax=Brassica oleracea var. oleracea TaxID=109376 RepID=UPI0006A6B4FD|nr:PREDICTED: U-box domain-containing protein 11-like [Brassica oleracea var. oleracea]